MIAAENFQIPAGHRTGRVLGVLLVLAMAYSACAVLADEPYARSKLYDLQHSRMQFSFDLGQKRVIGDVVHTLVILRETSQVTFDSVGLNIHGVTVNKSKAQFETTPEKLIVSLPATAKPGDKFEIEIRYDATPRKGMYFILPDKEYPDRPKQVWTQGESEDTRYYLPTYDEPNDRLTTETIITAPASWLTIANGKLIGVTPAKDGMKTWTWRESQPSSTYLTTVVAGEFDEVKDSWRGMPVTYYAPHGRGDRLGINYGRTPQMIELFSKRYGVSYPWEKYAQVMVDDFVAGGMENSSATTNTSQSLVDPKLVPEFPTGEDDLISHELTHQWFGDLVTCKDWGDIWLNEGFATFGEAVWQEAHFGKDVADYLRWEAAREWFSESNLFKKPIVRHDFAEGSDEFDGNAYAKGGWVLYMLRRQMGEDAFWAGIKHYLEVNRGKNVVTADFAKAMEEATHENIDQFLGQWIYGAGAPKFDLSYTYDDAKHQVALTVKQTQAREGRVGIFRVPAEVEITTAAGPQLYKISVSQENQTFDFPAPGVPLMVLFDKGGQLLKSAEFHKEKAEWLYQLKNASELADRADAAIALRKWKGDDAVAAALGDATRHDKAYGVRIVAAESLGELATPASRSQLLQALQEKDAPWVRRQQVEALGKFRDVTEVAAKLSEIARSDPSYRARAAALQALADAKAPDALGILTAAVENESPDDFLRKAALRAFATLGDDKAAPLLRKWSQPGTPIEVRTAAIFSLGRVEKKNAEITRQIASYLDEPHFPVRMAAIRALGGRGDTSAIPALESLLTSKDLSIEMVPAIKQQIARLKNGGKMPGEDTQEGGEATTAGGTPASSTDVRLERLEKLVQEMIGRLKTIESRLPAPKAPSAAQTPGASQGQN